MEILTELIKKRIAEIERDQKASAAYSNELSRAPNYAQDKMLLGMVGENMAVGGREWVVLTSLLNGGLAAQGSCFPPFGSYLYTDRDGNQSSFSILEFFMKRGYTGFEDEYARVKWEDGRTEELYVHFFIGAKLKPIEALEGVMSGE